MFANAGDYLKNIPKRKRWLTLSAIIAGIVFPWILVISIMAMHGSFSNVLDFGPLRYAFVALAGIGILVLIIAVTELFIQSHRRSGHSRFPFVITWLVTAISILITLALSAYVALPQIIRSGDTPPQLILTESQSGMPEIALVFWTKDKTTNTLEWGPAGSTPRIVSEQRSSHHHWF